MRPVESRLPIRSPMEEAPARGNVRDMAQQFEAVMLRQMIEAMRSSTRMGGEDESGSQMTEHLIEDALANHMAKSGGIGLADTLAAAVEEPGTHVVPRTDMHLILERGLRFTPLHDKSASPTEPGRETH
jgi:Rod binding domain-containing protein